MPTKYVRALPYVLSSGTPKECGLMLKFMYEFWGYCMNGSASTTTPGGLASPTPSNLATNFLEGTSVVSTGTNGVTVAGSNAFTATGGNFSFANHWNKYLVTWVPGSDSTDDSIYLIEGVPNSTTLLVTAASGGTPQSGTFQPTLTSRTGINYRVVDCVLASQSASAVGYIVFQTNASLVNTGQANSQFQVELINSNLTSMNVTFSPLGSWSGSSFGADGSTAVSPASGGTLFSALNTSIAGWITLIGDPTFLLTHAKSINSSGLLGAVLHIEVPYRLYPQANDTNPFTVLVDGQNGGVSTTSTTSGYGGGFEMIGHDTTTRKVRTLTRSLSGDAAFTSQEGVIGSGMDLRLSYGPTASLLPTNKAVTSEALLAMLGVAGQYAIGRVKAKNVRFCSSNLPPFTILGDGGEYIHLGNGVAWPWDNTIMGLPLLPLGA